MASFFNMKGTTQSEFSIGAKGPKLKKFITGDAIINDTNAPYLLLPINTIAEKIYLDHSDFNKYINKTTYTGNAATATKLSAKNIGLAITGITIVHTNPSNNQDGHSDGSGPIYGYVTAIDASKLVVGENNAYIPYAVLSGLVVDGDLNGNSDTDKIASSNHTHSQYLSTSTFTITTKDGDTALGQIKLDDANEVYSVSSQTAKLSLSIRDGSIVTADLHDSAVTTGKINDAAVTYAKIADGILQPAKFKAVDAGNGYAGDYSGKIGTVDSAHNLLSDGKIAGVKISDFLVSANSAYTNKVKNAETADYALNLKAANGTTKASANVITATNAVEAANKKLSDGNLVKWSSTGIDGNILGNAATATSAGKLTTAATLWGNSFDGASGQKLGSANGIAHIQYTGNITPGGNSETYNIGASDKKYSNIYVGKVNSTTIENSGTTKTKKLEISSNGDGSGIDVGGSNITKVNSISVKTISAKDSSGTSIGASGSPFHALYIDEAEHVHWTENGTAETLKGALDKKSNTGHTHTLASLTGTATTAQNGGYINNVALGGHKHTMSDITDISGVYQFKGTLDSVATENDELRVTVSGTPARGHVYNVLSAFTYKQKTYPAGTNIVYELDMVGDPAVETGRWKPLGGVFNIDLDDFITEISGSHFESLGATSDLQSAWEAAENGDGSAVAGTITTHTWYKARVNDKSGTFTTVLPRASATSFGLVKLGYTLDATNRHYPLLLDSNGKAYTTVNWVNRDTIDTYLLKVSSSASGTSEANINNNSVFFNLQHKHQFNQNDSTNGSIDTNIEKSINVVGAGQATVSYELVETNNVNKGLLTVNVPKRAGYPIPIINCTNEGSVVSSVITFDATSASSGDNGVVVGSNDEAVIKNNSMVLIYINHTEQIYSRFVTDGYVKFNIKIPAKYFGHEKSSVGLTNYADNDPVTFEVVYKTNLFGSPTNATMDNIDLSKKYFMGYLSIGSKTFGRGSTSKNYIVITDDIGATLESVEAPAVYYDYSTNKMKLHFENLNKIKSIIRRYTSTTNCKVYLRTYRLDGNNTFVPITALDHEITSSIANGAEIYTKSTLLGQLIETPETTINRIHFKNDPAVSDAKPGLIRSGGNIDLSSFSTTTYVKTYTRDYTKLRYQYIVKFKHDLSGSFEIGGKMSYDEVLVSKRANGNYNTNGTSTGTGAYSMIDIDVNKENIYA